MAASVQQIRAPQPFSDGSVADVPENDTDADWVCLGHIDPSRGQGLVIRTSDGSPTIASVKLGAGTKDAFEPKA